MYCISFDAVMGIFFILIAFLLMFNLIGFDNFCKNSNENKRDDSLTNYNYKKDVEKMIDNFDLINKMLKFESQDDFYFMQIILRKKDNNDIGADNIIIKSYWVDTQDWLLKNKKEIADVCNLFNARAYINVSRKSYNKAAFLSLEKIAKNLSNKEYKSCKKTYNSSCGELMGNPKRWVVDIDDKDKLNVSEVENYINLIELNNRDSNFPVVICKIPTPFGVHLITHPFNLQKFKEKYSMVDVHKNNPTILYYNNGAD